MPAVPPMPVAAYQLPALHQVANGSASALTSSHW